jgi:hypothetical protein
LAISGLAPGSVCAGSSLPRRPKKRGPAYDHFELLLLRRGHGQKLLRRSAMGRRLAALKEKDFAAIDAIVHDLVTQRRPADAMNVEVDQALDVFSTEAPQVPHFVFN